MATSLTINTNNAETGSTLYGYLKKDNQYWKQSTHTFETYNSANEALYASSIAEIGTSSDFSGTIDTTGIADDLYEVTVRQQMGGSVDFASDDPIGGGEVRLVAGSEVPAGSGSGGGNTIVITDE